MACNCVNDEGCPALSCDGTCSNARMINPHKQTRPQDDNFTNAQLSQLRILLKEVNLDRLWIDGFLKGFEYGQQNGQSLR